MAMDWENKISAMLRLAEDPGATQEERDHALERAMFFIAKYNIDSHALNMRNTTAEKPIKAVSETFTVTNPYRNLKNMLLNGISSALGGKLVVSGNTFHVFGLPDDLVRIKTLFYSLLVQGAMGMAAAQDNKPSYVHGKTFNHSWYMGFVTTVNARVRNAAYRATAEAKKEAPGTDLVLADRTNLVDAAVSARFGKLGKGRSVTSAKSSIGYSLGTQAGYSADIGQSRMGGSRRAVGA